MNFCSLKRIVILVVLVFFANQNFCAITEIYPEYFIGTQLPSELTESRKKVIEGLIQEKSYDLACQKVSALLNSSIDQFEKDGDQQVLCRDTKYTVSKFDFFVAQELKSETFNSFSLKHLAELIMESYLFFDVDESFNFLYRTVFVFNDIEVQHDLLEGFLAVAHDYNLLKSALPFAQGISEQLFMDARKSSTTSWQDLLEVFCVKYYFMHMLFYYKTFIDPELAISYGQIAIDLFFKSAQPKIGKIIFDNFDQITITYSKELPELKVELKELKSTIESDKSKDYLADDIAEVEGEIQFAKNILNIDKKQQPMVFMDLFASALTGLALDIVRTMQVQKEFERAKLYLKMFYQRLSDNGYSGAVEGLKQFISNIPKSWNEMSYFTDRHKIKMECIPYDDDTPKVFISTEGFDRIFA